jgi:Family of unknown function (DUF6529)
MRAGREPEMTEAVAAPERSPSAAMRRLVTILLIGGAVSLAIGVYANVHDPTAEQPYTLLFTRTIELKVWFATAAVALAVVQVILALRIYGKITVPQRVPSWLGDAHRLTGTVAFALTLPVAYQCLWALGFQSTDARVLIHSLLGCFFYGIFVVKVLAVRMHGLPGPTLPIVGGLVFMALVGIWCTSALWFFTSRPPGLPLF